MQRAALISANEGDHEMLAWLIEKIDKFDDLAKVLDVTLSVEFGDSKTKYDLIRKIIKKQQQQQHHHHHHHHHHQQRQQSDINYVIMRVAMKRVDSRFLRLAIDELNFVPPSKKFKSYWLAALMNEMILTRSMGVYEDFSVLFADWCFDRADYNYAVKHCSKHRDRNRQSFEFVINYMRRKLQI